MVLQTGLSTEWQSVFNAWGLLAMFCVTFFLHNFFIAPLLVYANRKWAYGVSLVVLIICFMGYQMDERWVDQGYMTEAVARVARIAFEELRLHRIEANIMPWNKRSLRVAEKCGFVGEGDGLDGALARQSHDVRRHVQKDTQAACS